MAKLVGVDHTFEIGSKEMNWLKRGGREKVLELVDKWNKICRDEAQDEMGDLHYAIHLPDDVWTDPSERECLGKKVKEIYHLVDNQVYVTVDWHCSEQTLKKFDRELAQLCEAEGVPDLTSQLSMTLPRYGHP